MIYGRIYKIYCNETGECYYGSTTETISRRLSVHKDDYKAWKKGTRKSYTTSYRIIERGNYFISLMEEGEFQNKDFMRTRERHYIENNECVNKNVPNRTQKEWYEAHREYKIEQSKNYREANKERINERQKEYDQAHKEQKKQQYTCECGSVICIGEKSRHLKTKKHIKAFSNKN